MATSLVATPVDDRGAARARRYELWGSLAVLLLAAVALLGDALLTPRVLSQADALLAFEPWREAAPSGFEPSNPLLLDQSIVCEPWMQLAAEQLRDGELPLWNPYNYCGQPYHAAASGGFASPLNWLYFAFPGHGTWEWLALVRLFLAGAFTLAWLRCFELSPFARLLGALCFELGGFMVAWLGHPHTAAAVFLPFLLWRIERSLSCGAARAPTPRAAAARDPALRALAVTSGWIAIGSGMTWLSGHAQTALHIALFAALYGLWRGAQARALARTTLALGFGNALGIVIGLPQLLPFAEYLRDSQAAVLFARFDVTSPLELAQAAAFLLLPFHFGAPQHGDYRGPLGHNLNYGELVGAYVGVLPLLLALVAVSRWRSAPPVRVLAISAAAALLVAWQIRPFYDVARLVPLLSSTKLLRLLLIANVAFAGLAAFGLDHALSLARLRGRARSFAAALALGLACADLYATGVDFNPSVERDRIAPETPVSRFLAADRSVHRVLALDNTVLMPNANVFHRIAMVSGYDSLEDKRLVGLVSRLAKDPVAVLRDLAPERVTADAPSVSFIKEIRAFDRIEALPIAALLNVKYVLSETPLPPPLVLRVDGPLRVYESPDALPRAFATSSFRWVEPQPDVESTWLHAERGAIPDPLRVELERVDGVEARAADEQEPRLQPCEIVEYAARRVVLAVRADVACCVVLSDTWAPGWTAALDGTKTPILRAHRALRGVLCPPGEHRIELRYDPLSVRIGLWAGGLGLAIAVGLARCRARGPRDVRA